MAHRVIIIEFTGMEQESGKIFDTTDEKTAKENGLYKENAIFKAIPVVTGKGDVLPGLDEALEKMKAGEEKTIEMGPEKAFGERKKDLVIVVPLQEFKKRKIQPFPGLIVDLDGQYGRVQTVSGGRVRLDLNSDLAGKNVEYKIKVIKEYTKPEEKAQALAEKYFPIKGMTVETKLEKGKLKIKLPKEIAKQVAPMVAPLAKTIKEIIPEVKELDIEESFEKVEDSDKHEDAGSTDKLEDAKSANKHGKAEGNEKPKTAEKSEKS